MNSSLLKNMLIPGKHGHLIGIGGVSMSALAEVLKTMGVEISGSDINEGATVEHLRSLGIPITIGHRAESVATADFIIRTAAVRDDNPEIAAAHEAGIPLFERAEGWGYIMRGYRNAVCIAGTHGKTTTTSMATHILMAADVDPTVMIGGTLPSLRSGYRIGQGDTIVLESCEYYNSFLNFFPTIAVILNIEADHLDFFRDLDDVKASFRKFASLVPQDGFIVANGDDANTMDAINGLDRALITFGLGENADVRGVNIAMDTGFPEFDVLVRGEFFVHLKLNIPGRQNVADALAAVSAAVALHIPAECVAEGLSAFRGAARRFEYKGSFAGACVYDDYAHHPGELHALLDAVSNLHYRHVIVAFQPHTFTRTKALFPDFVRELKRPDKLFLAEIYAAREKNTIGISSADLAAQIPGAVFCKTFDELEQNLRQAAGEGDIILTVGAGDIYKVGERLVK